MYRFWNTIIAPLCASTRIGSIVEIGIGEGQLTRLLIAHGERTGTTIHAIDPSPKGDAGALAVESVHLQMHPQMSLAALPALPADLVLIDGDHNWYTVLHELQCMHAWILKGTCEPIVLLHDTGWPYGKRDMYYNASTIPEAHRHPFANLGMLPGVAGLVDSGGLNAHLSNAMTESGPQNGVRCAIDDFLAEHAETWHFQELIGIHGLGILVPRARLGRESDLARFLTELRATPALQRFQETVESDRLYNLCKNERFQKQLDQSSAQMHSSQKRFQAISAQMRAMTAQAQSKDHAITILQEEIRVLQEERKSLNVSLDRIDKRRLEVESRIQHIESTRSFRWTAHARKWFRWLPSHNP